jgi:hypothetical protein
MKDLINKWFSSPKTTLGAIVIVGALAAFWVGKITTEQFMTIFAAAGIWIGVNAKDFSKTGKP